MRTNLITRLKEEWNNLDPVDPLRGLIADAIDALAEAQPSKPLTRDELRHMYQNSTAWQFYCDVDARLFGRPANAKGDV